MIDQALAYLRRDLRDRLALADEEVVLEGAAGLSGLDRAPGVRLTIVNVEQTEAGLVQPPAGPRPHGGAVRQPPPGLTLSLLIAFEFQTYEASLRHLSATIDLLHDTPLRTAAITGADNPFPAALESLSLALHSMSLDSLQRVWSLLGRPYAPSLLYRVHLSRALPGGGGH